MCRGPMAVSTELGPTIGRSGDSPVTDGASSGLAVKSDFTWSGCEVTATTGRRPASVSMRNTSPSSRWARDTNSIWRTLTRRVCSARGKSTRGGSCGSGSSPGNGPAGEAGTASCCVTGATVVLIPRSSLPGE